MDAEKDFYTVKQAADVLGLAEITVRKYCREGIIKAARTGNRYRIPKYALENFKGSGIKSSSKLADVDLPLEELEEISKHLIAISNMLIDVAKRLDILTLDVRMNQKKEG